MIEAWLLSARENMIAGNWDATLSALRAARLLARECHTRDGRIIAQHCTNAIRVLSVHLISEQNTPLDLDRAVSSSIPN